MVRCFGHVLLIGGTEKTTLQSHFLKHGTDTLPRGLGLNLCIIIAEYYIYIASKNEEDYFLDAFLQLAILSNKILIETSKAKLQVKM